MWRLITNQTLWIRMLVGTLLMGPMFFAGSLWANTALTLADTIIITLQRNPTIATERGKVTTAMAAVETASGSYDWALSYALAGSKVKTPGATINAFTKRIIETETDTRTTTSTFGAVRATRYGPTVTFANVITKTYADTVLDPTISNSSSLTLSIPLLRGAGKENSSIAELAAIKAVDAARLNASYQIGLNIRSAIDAYWTVLGAQSNLDSLTTTMTRATNTAQILEDRMQGGELAQTEYQRSLAELQLRQIDLDDARRALHTAQQNLILALGIDPKSAPSPPQLADTFPIPPQAQVLQALEEEALLKRALANRRDLRALNVQLASAVMQERKAKSDLLPQLDFEVTANTINPLFSESSDDIPRSFSDWRGMSGPNLTGTLTLTYPLGNHALAGVHKTQKQASNTLRNSVTLSMQSIRTAVSIAREKLISAQRKYSKSQTSLRILEVVAADTMRQMNYGEAGMTDLISVEDRLASVRLKVNAALLAYAKALSELRAAMGLLSSGEDPKLVFRAEDFLTLPSLEPTIAPPSTSAP
ncbi:MAG: TolC family protein [Magnetococcales bacterium]|nr:TolC family protein [Magnetococcales bacterium]